MYFVVMVLLWTLVAAVIAGNGREMHTALPAVALYGAQAGYWVIAGFALFDRIAREMVAGGANRFLFALFAVPFAMVAWPFIQMWPVSAYPVDLQTTVPAPSSSAPCEMSWPS